MSRGGGRTALDGRSGTTSVPSSLDPNGWGSCQRSTSESGRTLGGFVCALAGLLLFALGWVWLATTPEEQVSDVIDEARDALVAADGEAFLAHFAQPLRYRGKGDRADLEADLDRWKRTPAVRSVRILDREIEVFGDEAQAELVTAVGPNLLRSVKIEVSLRLLHGPDGWRVTSFDWRR